MAALAETRGVPPGPREVALRALVAIEQEGAYAGEALDAALGRARLSARDRALATELVYGVTRRRSTLDWVIGQVASRPPEEMTVWIRNILRQAAYQLMYLERVPAHAVAYEAVELAKRYGHPGVARFVNGVVRGLQRRLPHIRFPDPEEDPLRGLALRYAMPEWLVARWLREIGPEETEALLAAFARPPALCLRANRLRLSRAELLERLGAEGVAAVPTRWSPDGVVLTDVPAHLPLPRLEALRAGLCTVQDESSMLVAPVVAPEPGMTVLDLAAAPGGKSTHLAELMGDRGRVVAVDIHPEKIARIEANCRRLGLRSVETVCADARHVGWLMAGRADAVLCDLPCSGLGTLGRRPDARWRKSEADIAALAALQLEILDAAAAAVRPGGVLVYSTCTLTPEENGQVVAAFCARHPEFVPDDLRPYLPPGLREEPGTAEGWLQLWPHRHGTDGFFIARLRRGRQEVTG